MRPSTPSNLRYVTDDTPGITRRRRGRGYSYYLPDGALLQSPAERDRINALAIPPAYEHVWICPLPNGHLQATGRDAAERKQYRYHADYEAFRQQKKFNGLVAFGESLDTLRRRVNADLKRDGLDRQRVLAAAVRLMDCTLIRAGHGGQTNGQPTYGLATLREKHLTRNGSRITLEFRGKSGRQQQRTLDEPVIADVLRQCEVLPGRALFTYEDDAGQPQTIDAGDVNDYLAEYTGQTDLSADQAVTAKTFRTWGGTVLAAVQLAQLEPENTQARRHRQTVAVVREVAEALGNTPATCRTYYVHPKVFAAFEDGSLANAFEGLDRFRVVPPRTQRSKVEDAVLALLSA